MNHMIYIYHLRILQMKLISTHCDEGLQTFIYTYGSYRPSAIRFVGLPHKIRFSTRGTHTCCRSFGSGIFSTCFNDLDLPQAEPKPPFSAFDLRVLSYSDGFNNCCVKFKVRLSKLKKIEMGGAQEKPHVADKLSP